MDKNHPTKEEILEFIQENEEETSNEDE